MRMEPPVSEPSAIGTMPAATAAPDPPLEPPGTRAISHGLRVGGVVLPQANSCMRVLPMITAPAALKRATTLESRGSKAMPGAEVPALVGMSLVR